MRNPNQIAVVGVTGYTGFELARILLRHPNVVNPVFYVRDTQGAHCMAEMFPQLRGVAEAPLRALSLEAITQSDAGTAFLATPHDVSAEIVRGAAVDRQHALTVREWAVQVVRRVPANVVAERESTLLNRRAVRELEIRI